MRVTATLSFALMMSCTPILAESEISCGPIEVASKNGGVQQLSDAELDKGLCAALGGVADGIMIFDDATQKRCFAAVNAAYDEVKRRGRNTTDAAAKCRSR